MDKGRRNFLKLAAAGAAAATFGIKPTLDVLAGGHDEIGAGSKNRWAMVIDLGKWNDNSTRVFEACHRIHNVPDLGNRKEEVKWIWTAEFEKAFPDQHHEFTYEGLKGRQVPVLCNHCDSPPCVRACPTQATFKRELDGIVMMDFHRCIGCRFCVAACPYGSRSFNFRDPRPFIKKVNKEFPTRTKGVVEKCNFCAERLAVGKQPACVEACTNNELIFGDLKDPNSEVRRILREKHTIRRKPSLGTKPCVFYVL